MSTFFLLSLIGIAFFGGGEGKRICQTKDPQGWGHTYVIKQECVSGCVAVVCKGAKGTPGNQGWVGPACADDFNNWKELCAKWGGTFYFGDCPKEGTCHEKDIDTILKGQPVRAQVTGPDPANGGGTTPKGGGDKPNGGETGDGGDTGNNGETPDPPNPNTDDDDGDETTTIPPEPPVNDGSTDPDVPPSGDPAPTPEGGKPAETTDGGTMANMAKAVIGACLLIAVEVAALLI